MDNAKILLVEDDGIISLHITNSVQDLGYRVVGRAVTGEEAVEMAISLQPDLILMDIALGGDMDGVDAAAQIQEQYDIPVVYLTAYADESTLSRARVTGPFGYLLKPFDDHTLHATLEMALYKAQLERRLRESEARYRGIVETAQEGVWLMDSQFKTIYANQHMADMIGFPVEDLIATSLLTYIHPEDVEAARLSLSRNLNGQNDRIELRMVRPNGQCIWVLVSSSPVDDGRGRISSVLEMATDITARKNAEESLRRSESFYRSLFEGHTAVMLLIDPMTHQIVDANPAASNFYGYSLAELKALKITDIAHQELSQPATKVFHTHSQENNGFLFSHRLASGEIREVEVYSGPIIVNGYPLLYSIVHDVTERHQAERALRISEERYRLLFEGMINGIALYEIIKDENGMPVDYRLLEVNPAFEQLVGRTSQQLVGRTAKELMPGLGKKWIEIYSRVIETGQPVSLETFDLTLDKAIAITAYSPEPDKFVAIFADVTARKQAEALLKKSTVALLESEARFRSVFEGAGIGIFLADSQGRPVDVNPKLVQMFGLERDELFELITREYTHPEEYLAERKQIVALLAGETDRIESVKHYIRKDGKVIWGRLIVTLVMDASRQVRFVVGMVEDITEQKNAEIRLQHQLTQLDSLRKIDAAINSSFNLRLILNIILEQLVANLQVDAADVLLFDPVMQRLEYARGLGFRNRNVEHAFVGLGDGGAGKAASENRWVKIDNLAEDRDFRRMEILAGENFRTYYGIPLSVKGQVKGVLEIFHRSDLTPDQEWLDYLETLAGQAAIAIDNAELFERLQRSNSELMLAYDDTIEGWARALDLHHSESEEHTEGVVKISLAMAEILGINQAEIMHFRRGALLHDIGKFGISEDILRKPDLLTDEEWEVMREHPVIAHKLLAPINFLRPALDIPYCHHEKWDGSGYPRGLKGQQIPLMARIFAIADVVEALLSKRPYRDPWPPEKVIQYVREQSGKHFDPAIAQVFLDHFQEMDDRFRDRSI